MRKPAELPDDVAVPHRVREIGLAQPAHEFDGPVLVRQALRVAERQVHEDLQSRLDFAVVARCDRDVGRAAGIGVGCVHRRGAAE